MFCSRVDPSLILVFQCVEAEINESIPTISDILRDGNQLLKNGYGDEKLSNDLASVNGNRWKCEDEAPVLVSNLESLADDCKKLNEGIDEVCKKLDGIEDKTDSFSSVGTDADSIKEQMEEVKVCKFCMFYGVQLLTATLIGT